MTFAFWFSYPPEKHPMTCWTPKCKTICRITMIMFASAPKMFLHIVQHNAQAQDASILRNHIFQIPLFGSWMHITIHTSHKRFGAARVQPNHYAIVQNMFFIFVHVLIVHTYYECVCKWPHWDVPSEHKPIVNNTIRMCMCICLTIAHNFSPCKLWVWPTSRLHNLIQMVWNALGPVRQNNVLAQSRECTNSLH